MLKLEHWIIALIAIFAPVQGAIATAALLVVMDLFLGIWAAKRRSEAITSSGIKRTVGKVALYEAAICLAFLAQTYLIGNLLPVTSLVTALIGLTELKSVFENLDSISGGSLLKSIIARITQSEFSGQAADKQQRQAKSEDETTAK